VKILIPLITLIFGSILFFGPLLAEEEYGHTEFQASGSREGHQLFLKGLLQLHNFEYEDARGTFLEVQKIDPQFIMAYWGEALTYEHPLWSQFDTEASRSALAKLGSTPEQRVATAPTEREKSYLRSVNILFGEGSQEEREIAYSSALEEIYRQYPDDIDAAALHALSLLTISHGGRDFSLYMKAGAITEDILDRNPRHPGALHYNIHSFDDPVHAPLGLRAADAYAVVAPSAVHALHMGSHIYFALGMWEKGSERNARSFEEAMIRRSSQDDPIPRQGYHALTWLIYSLTQEGKRGEAREKLAIIEDQVEKFKSPQHRQNFISARASYVIDTQEFSGHFAQVAVDYEGLAPFFVATDQYVRGIVALHRADMEAALQALAGIGGEETIQSRERSAMTPKLLRMSLQAQIEMVEGNTDRALVLLEGAAELEDGLSPDYGPAIPAQPSAELLADTYLALGDPELAARNYERALAGFVGRERSLLGLSKARAGQGFAQLQRH